MDEYCKILIVDDEFIIRQGIRHMMDWEAQGFQVVGEASNGKEALELMEKFHPHIVLCDIAMPIMNGLDFVRVVHRKYPETRVLVLSGHDRFEYVRQALLNGAVDYILKPTLSPDELSRILEKIVSGIPGMQFRKKTFSTLENRMESFLKGRDKELKIQEFNEIFPHSCYRIVGIPLRVTGTRDFSQIIYEKTEEFLKTNGPGNHLKFLCTPEFLCIVFNYPLKDEKQFSTVIQELAEQLNMIHGQILAVMGRSRKRLEDLKKDFSNPGFLEAEVFYHKGIHFCEIQEMDRENQIQKFDFRRFSIAVANENYIEAAEMFREYIHRAVENRMPEFKLKNQTKNLLYNLIGNADTRIEELEEIRYKYFAKIDEVTYKEDFMEVFCEMMDEVLGCFENGEQSYDKNLQEILDYIGKHYQEDLDLSDLANNFNFNYSYISTYFNTKMGENFSEYLNRIRINHACEYLERGGYSIAEISDLVGYSDQSYFSRVFKKISGETPSAYRRGRRLRNEK